MYWMAHDVSLFAISVFQHQHSPVFFSAQPLTGLHKLWYPVVRDMSKFGAHGEHGDVFLFSNLGAL